MARSKIGMLVVATLAATAASSAVAASIEEFYKGNTITIISTAGPGGTLGAYSRVAGLALASHLPGKPTVIDQPMPGAGGNKGASYCYNAAPKNGLVLCLPLHTMTMSQMLEDTGVRFDAAQFNWIGRAATVESVLTIWHTAPIKSLADATATEVVIGATGKGSESYMDPKVVNATLGTRFKLVMGYRGGADLEVAMERGEIFGCGQPLAARFARSIHWIEQKLVWFPYQVALKRSAQLPDVPTLIELARNDEQRQIFEFMSARAAIGRAFLAPPGVPADRVAALRQAFDKGMQDAAVQAEAKRLKIPLAPLSGAELEAIVRKNLETPKDVIAKVKDILR